MSSHFNIKQGNLDPPLTLYLTDREGNVPEIAGKAVRFFVWREGATTYDVAENRTGNVLDPVEGAVQMAWQPGDTAQAGVLHAEVDLVTSGVPERRETFPSEGSADIVIHPRIQEVPQ